jgi:hypothetical protein
VLSRFQTVGRAWCLRAWRKPTTRAELELSTGRGGNNKGGLKSKPIYARAGA